MKKLLGIMVLGLLCSLPAHSKVISTDKSVNDYLKNQEYELYSTHKTADGNFYYHLRGIKSETHDLLVCFYDFKIEKKPICWIP